MHEIKNYIFLKTNDCDDGNCVFEGTGNGFQEMAAFLAGNMEVGETYTIKLGKGIREEDESGNYEYIVKEAE